MRPIDEAIRRFDGADGLEQKLLLLQFSNPRLDFELPEVYDFLLMASFHDSVMVRNQASRVARGVRPLLERMQLGRAKGYATDEAGTWSQYSLGGRAFTDTLMKLVEVEKHNLADVDMGLLHASAMHMLSPCIERAVREATGAGDYEVRATAIRALGQLHAPQSVTALSSLVLEDDFAVLAAAALGDLGSTDALNGLLVALDAHRDKAFYEELVAELAGFDGGKALSALLSAIDGAPEGVRINGAIALGAFDEREAHAALRRMMQDESDSVRACAITSIGQCRVDAEVASIGAVYRSSEHPLVREAAVRALGMLDEPSAVAVLCEALEDRSATVRALAIESLVRLKVPDADLFHYAAPLVDDDDERVSANAILALAPVDSSLALQKIFTFLKASTDYGRAQGVYCLSYVQNPTTRDLLNRIVMRDASELVTRQVVKALAKYPRDEAIPRLIPLLHHEHRGVRVTAARVLGYIGRAGDLSVFEAIVERFEAERNQQVKVAFAETLASVADPSQHLTIAAFADEAQPEATAAVLHGLDHLGNIASVDEFDKWLDINEASIKGRAAVALWHLGHSRLVSRLSEGLDLAADDDLKANLEALQMLGLSLRHLPELGTYPLLLSELKTNSESDVFKASAFADVRQAVFVPTEAVRHPAQDQADGHPSLEVADLSELAELSEAYQETVDGAVAGEKGSAAATPAAPTQVPSETTLSGPRPHDLSIMRALDSLVSGRSDEALEAAQDIVSRNGSVEARFLLGKVLLHHKQVAEAEKHLAMLADSCDDFVNPLLTLVGICQHRAARRQSVAYFAAAMGAFLDCLRAQLVAFEQLLAADRFDKIPAFVREIGQQLPFMDKIHGWFGSFLLKTERADAAYDQLLLGHLADPSGASTIINLARAALRSGRWAFGRVLLLETLLQALPKDFVMTSHQLKARLTALTCLGEMPHDDDGLAVVKRVFRQEEHPEIKARARELIHSWGECSVDDFDDAVDCHTDIALEQVATQVATGLAHEAIAEAERLADGERAREARFLQARALLALDRPKDAGAMLERLVGEETCFINPLLLLVGLCQQAKDHRSMFVHFAGATRIALQLLEEQCAVLDRLLMDGELDAYAWFMRDVSAQLPTFGTTHRRTGFLLLHREDATAAYHHLFFSHLCNPADIEVQRGLLHAAMECCQYDVATFLCNNLLSRSQRENVRRDAEACLDRIRQATP